MPNNTRHKDIKMKELYYTHHLLRITYISHIVIYYHLLYNYPIYYYL